MPLPKRPPWLRQVWHPNVLSDRCDNSGSVYCIACSVHVTSTLGQTGVTTVAVYSLQHTGNSNIRSDRCDNSSSVYCITCSIQVTLTLSQTGVTTVAVYSLQRTSNSNIRSDRCNNSSCVLETYRLEQCLTLMRGSVKTDSNKPYLNERISEDRLNQCNRP